MDNKEAKEYLEDDYKSYEKVIDLYNLRKEHSGYPSEKQALKLAIKVLEKQIPVEPEFCGTQMGLLKFKCNTCKRMYFAKTNVINYCQNCGQKLRKIN